LYIIGFAIYLLKKLFMGKGNLMFTYIPKFLIEMCF